MKRLIAAAAVTLLAVPLPASAQTDGPTCPEFEGIVCDGWVTDAAGILEDLTAIENAIGRVVANHGHQIAVVVIDTSGSMTPRQFAEGIGNTWGVGQAGVDDGIVILVALAERRTEIVTGSGLTLSESALTAVASSANSFFGAGDFDGGISAVLGSLDVLLAGGPTPAPTVDTGGRDEPGGFGFGTVVLAIGLIGGGAWLVSKSRAGSADRIRSRRAQQVDTLLAGLEPTGQELPLASDYAQPPPTPGKGLSTADAVQALRNLLDRHTGGDKAPLKALWAAGAVEVVDRDRLTADYAVPLELKVSDERSMLEDAVQQAARDALAVGLKADDAFEVALDETRRLVESLRPHRVAAARNRAAAAIADSLTDTEIGPALVTDLGERLHRAAAALDLEAPLAASVAELEAAYAAARTKTDRLKAVYDGLPDGTTRPAVAAALADLDDDPDDAIARYELVREELEAQGDVLAGDGLQLPAIAALLLMNRDEDNVAEFVDTYQRQRTAGSEPAEAVEYALAGLRDPDEISRVRAASRRLSLPVSITAALLRRRDDGPEVYQALLDELAGQGIDTDTLPTVAGVLAISLEPAQALRRWVEARKALADLGLSGSYADVAAAFGASDRRGPRAFALAYAAQRQALARSDIEDADRFAPELAHEGTSGQTDTWTGDPISPSYGSFDPFTFFYYHWIITRGTSGSYGWEPVYRHASWSADRGSWGGFGGGGGFGSSGSSWGGSSWGSGGGSSFG
ncbi:MAG: TPM domain-containing protein, partial [Actinomycetota bacterium]